MNITFDNITPQVAAALLKVVAPRYDPKVSPELNRFYGVALPQVRKANGKQSKSDKARALYAAGERSLKVIAKKTGLGYHGVYAAVIRGNGKGKKAKK